MRRKRHIQLYIEGDGTEDQGEFVNTMEWVQRIEDRDESVGKSRRQEKGCTREL